MVEFEKEVNKQDKEPALTHHMLIEDGTEDIESFNPLYHQILAAVGPILLTVFGAFVGGYSAVLLPQLKAEDRIIKATAAEESWIASIAIFPIAIGCIIGGWSMEKHGRVNANQIAAIVSVIGWGFIYCTSSMSILLTGRFITGLAVGIASPGATCFLGEVVHPKYRGLFLSLTAFAISLGLLISHIMGIFLHWKTVAAICALLPVICIMIFAILPESHIWYMKRNDFKMAQKTFFWYRGRSNESINELVKIFNDKSKAQSQQMTISELFVECSKPQFIKPFLIMNLYFFTSQITGNNVLAFYTVDIMQDTVPNLDKYTATILVDLIRAILSIVGCILIKKYKIRPLTMISGLGVAFSLVFISFFIYISQSYEDNSIITFMPMIGFIGYIIFINIGFLPLAWTICSEIFPAATRGIGGGICTCNNFFALFLVVKTSPDMFESIGIAGTFIAYAILVLISTLILYFVLPETKNRTLKDIEGFFSGEHKKNQVHSVKTF